MTNSEHFRRIIVQLCKGPSHRHVHMDGFKVYLTDDADYVFICYSLFSCACTNFTDDQDYVLTSRISSVVLCTIVFYHVHVYHSRFLHGTASVSHFLSHEARS